MKKLFGELNITWVKLIIFAIIAGVYTGVMTLIPQTLDTSFRDISISFEVWILFGIIIIMNSKSPIDSALKCFVFFLISQPLVYLVQVPFHQMGWGLFVYYKPWFTWTLFTIPMGFIGHFLKKDKWYGLFILSPIILFLGFHYMGFFSEVISFFPHHLLSAIFCFATLLIYPIYIYKNKVIKIIGIIISALVIIGMTAIGFGQHTTQGVYKTTILCSSEDTVVFNDQYKVSLKDESFGKVYIVYEKNIEDYMINAEFKKLGDTELIVEAPDGTKYEFTLTVKRASYDINKK